MGNRIARGNRWRHPLKMGGDVRRMDFNYYQDNNAGGTFDPQTSGNGAYADAAAFNKKVKLLWLGVGTEESPNTKNFHEALDKHGIKNVYFESPGTAHEWLTWRRCLNDFAPRLFR
jgi:S-formylglutathione hydrolase FrmB